MAEQTEQNRRGISGMNFSTEKNRKKGSGSMASVQKGKPSVQKEKPGRKDKKTAVKTVRPRDAKRAEKRNEQVQDPAMQPGEGLDKLEGRNPVFEALKSGRSINRIFVSKGEKEGSIKDNSAGKTESCSHTGSRQVPARCNVGDQGAPGCHCTGCRQGLCKRR